MQFGKKSLNEKFVYILFPLCCVSSSTIAFAASVWMPDQRVEIVVGVSAGYWLVILCTTSLTDLLLDPLKKDLSDGHYVSGSS